MLKELPKLSSYTEYSNLTSIVDLSKNPVVSITFQELDDRINDAAMKISSLKFPYQSRIGISGGNSLEWVVSYYAVRRAGHTAVLIDPRLPSYQIDSIIVDSKCCLIISEDPVHQSAIKLQELPKSHSQLDIYPDYREAIIIYTSGSTRQPSGVILRHDHRRWTLKNHARVFDPSRKSLVSAPLSHINALSNIEINLSTGRTTYLLPKFDAISYAESLKKYPIDTIVAIPGMLSKLVDSTNEIFPNIKDVSIASAPTSQPLFEKIKKKFPTANIKIAYGLTEVGISIFGPHPNGDPVPEQSVGYETSWIQYRIKDHELQVRHPAMAERYTNQDRSKWTDDGFFRTGDRFYKDANGFYFWQGRVDNIFKSGGNSIFPEEIESMIQSYPGVKYAVVVPVPDNVKGYKPVGFIVADDDVKIDSLQDWLLERLPRYTIPRLIYRLQDLPFNNNHKIDRKLLIDKAIQHVTCTIGKTLG